LFIVKLIKSAVVDKTAETQVFKVLTITFFIVILQIIENPSDDWNK